MSESLATIPRLVRIGAILIPVAACMWVLSPRFSIGGPSLVDDWAALAYAPGEISDLGRLLSAGGGRFRPGWVVWNEIQWHGLGAPEHMVGPNAWGIVRMLVFIAGVALLVLLTLPMARARSSDPPRFPLVLAVIAPLLVVTTPRIAVDFARFGPQEPLLVGCMALGAVLLVAGLRVLADVGSFRRVMLGGACVVLGYPLWVLGVYHKEVAVCVLVLALFVLLAKRSDAQASYRRRSRSARYALAALLAAVILPVVHVAAEVFSIRGKTSWCTERRSDSGLRRGGGAMTSSFDACQYRLVHRMAVVRCRCDRHCCELRGA